MASQRPVALVTGGSRGIGRGCVIRLAEAGHDVVINYHSAADAAEEAAEICRDEYGVDALVVQANVSSREQVEAMFAQAAEQFGRLDVLVANAAQSRRSPFVELSVQDIEHTLGICMWGTIHATQIAAQTLVEQGTGGSLIFISSVHHRENYANSATYNMAKGAGHALYKTLAVELVSHRIRANIVEPGWIDTPGERKWISDEEIVTEGAKLPWGRLGTIDDIGHTVAFLASDKADYITGAMLRVDGGFVLPSISA